MNSTELHDAIRSVPHLAALSALDVDALASAMTLVEHDAGFVFIQQGKRADGAFLILDGEIQVLRDPGGEVNRLHKGELFGLVALVDDEPRSASCKAVGAVRAAALPLAAFNLLFNAHAPIAFALQRALAAQLVLDFRKLDNQIREALKKK